MQKKKKYCSKFEKMEIYCRKTCGFKCIPSSTTTTTTCTTTTTTTTITTTTTTTTWCNYILEGELSLNCPIQKGDYHEVLKVEKNLISHPVSHKNKFSRLSDCKKWKFFSSENLKKKFFMRQNFDIFPTVSQYGTIFMHSTVEFLCEFGRVYFFEYLKVQCTLFFAIVHHYFSVISNIKDNGSTPCCVHRGQKPQN